jgi:hypothetical protein
MNNVKNKCTVQYHHTPQLGRQNIHPHNCNTLPINLVRNLIRSRIPRKEWSVYRSGLFQKLNGAVDVAANVSHRVEFVAAMGIVQFGRFGFGQQS